jgi:hypothetical protein
MEKPRKETCRSDADYVNKLDHYHKRQKEALGTRVQVLRVLVHRCYDDRRDSISQFEFGNSCEGVLDNMLAKHEYKLEFVIDKFREMVPEMKNQLCTCDKCGYREIFCFC